MKTNILKQDLVEEIALPSKKSELNWFFFAPLFGLLFYRLVAPSFLGYFMSAGVDLETEGSVLNQAILASLFLLASIVLFNNRGQFLSLLKTNKLLIILLIYAMVSCFWSEVPFVSFKRWIQFLGIVLIAMAAMTSPNGAKGIRNSLENITVLSVIISFILIIIGAPGSSIVGAWAGLFHAPGALGEAAAITIAVWLPVLFTNSSAKRKGLAIAIIFLAVTLIFGCTRATALISMVVILATFLMVCLHIPIFIQVIFLSVVTLLIAFFVLNVISDPLVFAVTLFNRDTTLTGRADLWEAIWYAIKDHPLWGVGYNGFWTGPEGLSFHYVSDISWVRHSSHSGYLDTLNELGFVGLSFFILFLSQTVIRTFRFIAKWAGASPMFLIVITAIVHNLTATSFCRQVSIFWIVLVLAAIASGPSIFGSKVKRETKSNSIDFSEQELLSVRTVT